MSDTREMMIAGITFTVSTPYVEGHTVDAAEARVLNQTRCENISNAMRKKIQELADDEGNYTDEAVEAAAAMVAEYDEKYTFNMPSAGGRKATDPLEKEALSIARAMVSAQIKEAGYKIKEIDAEVIEANVEAFAADPAVIELAKQRLAERAELAGKIKLNLTASAE